MQKIKAAVGFGLITIMLLTLCNLAPIVLAKDLNYASDVYKIDYLDGGGRIAISMPTSIKTSVFPDKSYTQMQFRFSHCNIPNSGITINYLVISFYDTARAAAGRDPWEPFAMITDADDAVVAFEETFWYGTWLNMDATLYKYTSGPNAGQPLPAILSANNVIQVDKGDLTIERHGNNIVACLNEQVTVKRAFTPSTTFTVPTFSVELASYGHSFSESNAVTMLGWTGATGYTIVHDAHGFNANGVFTSQGTYLNGVASADAEILMQGTHTFLKPSAT